MIDLIRLIGLILDNAENRSVPHCFRLIAARAFATVFLDRLLGLYWTGLTLLNGFPFLVYFFLFIVGRAVD